MDEQVRMSEQILREIKTFEQLTQTLQIHLNNIENGVERLRSIEQLLERVAESNENMLKLMSEMMTAYETTLRQVNQKAEVRKVNKKR